MYKVVFYRKSNGEAPVLDYIKSLGENGSKNARIKRNKILQYIKVLEEKGTRAGEPIVKHIEGEIWELRPTSDRILFAAVIGGQFVLLHSFVKKTQKTPVREVEQAKRELADFIERSKLH